jgi:hypothetical protein
LLFVVNVVHLTDSYDRPDRRLSLPPATIPLEDEPPLLVEADRMEALQIATQLFKMVVGWHP